MYTYLRRGSELRQEYSPLVDMYETGDSLVFEIDLPGVKPEDVTVQVMDDELLVEGFKREQEDESMLRYIRMERGPRCFRRTLGIPVSVNPLAAKAVYRDGVLRVELPKLVDEAVRIEIERL